MKSNVTLKDIAKTLNLSTSTVSKALNNSYEISVKTTNKVKELASKLNYIPNDVARSLKSNITKRIGVIVPNVQDDFFAKVIHAIELEANKLNYKLIICLSNDVLSKEADSVSFLMNGSVDGVLISLAEETQNKNNFDHFKSLGHRNFPLVMFDRVSEEIICDKITVNDFEATYDAVKYLVKTNCKNIAFLSTIANTSVGALRTKGYCKAIEDELSASPNLINITDYNEFEGKLIKALQQHKIDALITADQLSAICAINIIQKKGLHVPNDIAVIGFTDGAIPKYTLPSLTTINQKPEEMGKLAFKTLMKRIHNNDKKIKNIVIETELVKRASTY
ncbi:LacI family DNA-binding transcriptional regulator [Tenacibaculum sp. M341]|uniref:LacI family DNA-binding transcriptional regulator n=1 Tax=Tenacibaculum sp. M341 TaxID=2530339 RepID=UPI00104430EF|nr:LacI family DNA-binding transcriptional regulator [Tenacibaculum sp. M341]TCI90394.1 LacI family transcriptional regulator [Tenacibaculum sp. M341]